MEVNKEPKKPTQNRILKDDLPTFGVRHLQGLVIFFGIFSAYLIRVNLSVAIVAMSPEMNSTDYFEEKTHHISTFQWNGTTKSLLLASFFIGYMLGNFPGSVLGCHFNNKTLLLFSTISTSALALVTPLAVTTYGATALFLIRLVQGLVQSLLMPMCNGIMARWIPPVERGRLMGFVVSSVQLGTMTTLAGSGWLASTRVGWPSIFYVGGTINLTWAVIFYFLGAETPQAHALISRHEIRYIEESLQGLSHSTSKAKVTPWKEIFTSLPLLALTSSHLGQSLGFWLLLSEMPTFISVVHNFKIKDNGMLTALPYLTMFLLQIPVSYIAEIFNKQQCMSVTTSRKMWNSVSMWGGAFGLILLGFLDESAIATIVLYISIVAIGCCCNLGFNLNHMDLSPNYAGLLMGITNAIASSGGIFAPLVVGIVIKDQKSITQWRYVFFTGAGILFFSNLFFVLFGSAETQPWNSLPEVKKKNEPVKKV
ncbi:putative inorganic phosphate cotransporter [Daktulosphaira vitifoliae]|uniref:putative inorganic phosphate cotransporter n=1 Tax=Daktulosphaira vitifoliae TaxID=58002 RepID=UPI0021AADE63|nr:putative inorganic phosphate cotransporter [Daktulosphaira vitifoliae]